MCYIQHVNSDLWQLSSYWCMSENQLNLSTNIDIVIVSRYLPKLQTYSLNFNLLMVFEFIWSRNSVSDLGIPKFRSIYNNELYYSYYEL